MSRSEQMKALLERWRQEHALGKPDRSGWLYHVTEKHSPFEGEQSLADMVAEQGLRANDAYHPVPTVYLSVNQPWLGQGRDFEDAVFRVLITDLDPEKIEADEWQLMESDEAMAGYEGEAEQITADMRAHLRAPKNVWRSMVEVEHPAIAYRDCIPAHLLQRIPSPGLVASELRIVEIERAPEHYRNEDYAEELMPCFDAYLGDMLIGSLQLDMDTDGRGQFYVQSIAIDAAYKRRGAGTRLFDAALDSYEVEHDWGSISTQEAQAWAEKEKRERTGRRQERRPLLSSQAPAMQAANLEPGAAHDIA